MSPTGKGKLRDGRFPWLVYPSPESPQVFGFKLYISFNVTTSSEKEGIVIPATLVTEVGGDIDEIFKYVFSTSVSSPGFSLKLNGSLRPCSGSTIYIQHEMTALPGRNGGFKFLASCKINKSAADDIYKQSMRNNVADLSIELVKLYNDASTSSAQLNSLQELNESIFKSKATSDFALVAENGVAMTCHRNFLEAHCPSFEIAFGNQSTPIQHRLNLSEEGLKALLEFVYCLKLDIPREKPSVALELLDIGVKKQMPMLTKAINSLLVEQPDDWFGFDAALQLFLHSIKLQGYDELKKKAVRSMKLKGDEMESSELCDQL
ncbi:hypothetical protein Ocin01_18187 [Orchesella cincta]|uniref:BTB domain-containing protein n=1 Tax=Orchesella cincta TaxID=48709 RepID=A0A1D2M692_ORCCI|nr:hypothetical protein Ocin01_18187 [Orchesella cincta]